MLSWGVGEAVGVFAGEGLEQASSRIDRNAGKRICQFIIKILDFRFDIVEC
jgi:hypothetical protein